MLKIEHRAGYGHEDHLRADVAADLDLRLEVAGLDYTRNGCEFAVYRPAGMTRRKLRKVVEGLVFEAERGISTRFFVYEES